MKFQIHDLKSAPEKSKPVLLEAEKSYGFIPNLLGVLAESPLAVAAYPQLNQLIKTKSSLSPQEQQIALLTVSHENNCPYCMGAHCAIAATVQTPDSAIQAALAKTDISDVRINALVNFTRNLVKHRGWVDEDCAKAFLEAGYTRAQMLDVLVITALKTLSNYANHLAHTPLDEEFSAGKQPTPAASVESCACGMSPS